MYILALKKEEGGMNAMDIGIYAKSLFVYPITKYLKYKIMQEEVPYHMQWLENKIGEKITRKIEGHDINITNCIYIDHQIYN